MRPSRTITAPTEQTLDRSPVGGLEINGSEILRHTEQNESFGRNGMSGAAEYVAPAPPRPGDTPYAPPGSSGRHSGARYAKNPESARAGSGFRCVGRNYSA